MLLIYVATQLIYAFDTTDRFDPLPSAPAVAVLVGEGAFGLVAFVGWLAARSRRRG